MNKYYKQGIALLMTAVMLSGVACSNKDDKEESEAESVVESVSETAETVSASVFGTPSPFTVLDPETGLELQLVGNGSFCYDLGENEVSEDQIMADLITSFQSRAVNAVEAEGYSNLIQNIPDIERGIESDLRLALGIVNVDVAINACILNEESQEAYDAATGR